MKTIARYSLITAALISFAATPAMFAEDRYRDLARDYSHVARLDNDIRRDRAELRDDREDGRYRQVARDRADLRHDYIARDRQFRDIRRDRFIDRCR